MHIRHIALATCVLFGTVSIGAQGRQTTPPPPTPKPSATTPAGAATNDIAVTINYTGNGVIDAQHGVLVFLLSDPNIGPNSRPIGASQIATKNLSTVTFKNQVTTPVYVLAIYNEKGTYDGKNGPPPAGTPIGMYTKAGKPAPVTAGPKTAIRLTFDGSKKFGQ